MKKKEKCFFKWTINYFKHFKQGEYFFMLGQSSMMVVSGQCSLLSRQQYNIKRTTKKNQNDKTKERITKEIQNKTKQNKTSQKVFLSKQYMDRFDWIVFSWCSSVQWTRMDASA